ncbi:MAG TPA: hypothetical protein VIO64_15390 [Pseudobacteroides sp.]|uniref:hypothetical protein n=1 Tax=Pseudobacteroides sp. TaxID=1968840 RepID=UPI002F9533A0
MKGVFTLIFSICFITSILPTHVLAKNAPKQGIVWQGSDVYITFKHNSKVDMHLIFGPCGINNTFNLKSIYTTSNSKRIFPWVTDKSNPFLISKTDWLGPYVVKALVKGDDSNPAFTGGWHGSNGNATGAATAKTTSISVKVNGKAITKNKSYYGNAEVTVINLIQAYNTKKKGTFVLKEVVKYSFTPKKVGISITTTALEDVLLERYYGLQAQVNSWKGKIQYSNGKTGSYGKYSDSGPAKKSTANSYVIASSSNAYKLRAKIDSSVGLGKLGNLSPELPAIFMESYGKVYFNLVNGKNKKITKGQSTNWKGSYEFL